MNEMLAKDTHVQTNHPGVDAVIDLSETMKTINASLYPGMSAEFVLMGYTLVVRYSFRVMVKGKRKTAGPFYSRLAAMQALMHMKSGMETMSNGLLSESTQSLNTALRSLQTSKLPGLEGFEEELAEQRRNGAAGGLVFKASAENCVGIKEMASQFSSMQALDDLVVDSETPGYLFTAESTLEITDSAGKVWHISPAMQREYNAWCFANSAASQPAQASQSNGTV